MATILRTWSYQYQWLYDAISWMSALAVGGEVRFRQLALEGLPLAPDSSVLDLCCGSGQATRYLVTHFQPVTGLDASPKALQRAKVNVPEATYVEGWAERQPFADQQFDLVHTSVALHEMQPDQRQQILTESYRVLKPGGWLALVDLHQPTHPLMVPGLYLFLWLFETETAWDLVRTDLVAQIQATGFRLHAYTLHAGGSLQVIQAQKPS